MIAVNLLEIGLDTNSFLRALLLAVSTFHTERSLPANAWCRPSNRVCYYWTTIFQAHQHFSRSLHERPSCLLYEALALCSS